MIELGNYATHFSPQGRGKAEQAGGAGGRFAPRHRHAARQFAQQLRGGNFPVAFLPGRRDLLHEAPRVTGPEEDLIRFLLALKNIGEHGTRRTRNLRRAPKGYVVSTIRQHHDHFHVRAANNKHTTQSHATKISTDFPKCGHEIKINQTTHHNPIQSDHSCRV